MSNYKQGINVVKEEWEDTGNRNENWTYFKNAIIRTATDVVLCRTAYGRRWKQTAWWTEELQLAVKEKMKRFRRWMKTRRAEDRENYNLARQEAERVKQIAKQESFEQIGNDLENDFDGAKKLIYHMAKNYRKESQPPSYAILSRPTKGKQQSPTERK